MVNKVFNLIKYKYDVYNIGLLIIVLAFVYF